MSKNHLKPWVTANGKGILRTPYPICFGKSLFLLIKFEKHLCLRCINVFIDSHVSLLSPHLYCLLAQFSYF